MRRKILLFLSVPAVMWGLSFLKGEPAEGGIIFHRHRGGAACCGEVRACSGWRARRFLARSSCCEPQVVVQSSCCGVQQPACCDSGINGVGSPTPPAPTGHFEYRREPAIDSQNQPTAAPENGA